MTDIVLTCYLSPSGLSMAGRAFFKCLTSKGARVIPSWLMPPGDDDLMEPGVVARMRRMSCLKPSPGPIQFHAGLPQSTRVLEGRKCLLGSVVVEGGFLSPGQAKGCMKMDAILAPSSFCRDACLRSGMPKNKVFNAPYPLDLALWNPGAKPAIPRGDRFRFLYMNSWYERKGYDVLLRAWWSEFTANDPVELVLKSYRESSRNEPLKDLLPRLAAQWGMDRSREAPIVTLDEPIPDPAMPSFMRSFDAYVSPHRSEGFGMNIWHAMAIGVPVICTDYGGCTDFAKGDTAWLVNNSGMVSPSDKECSLFGHLRGMSWAEPDEAGLRRQMRACMNNPAEAACRAFAGARLVAARYSFDEGSRLFCEALAKASPDGWDGLRQDMETHRLVNQPAPRFESPGEPIRMVEI